MEAVTLYDNFSSGREWHYAHHENDRRLRVIHGDVKDLAALERYMEGHDTVIHLASNPDIARAAVEPDIDFREGTFLTQQIVEAMRRTRTPNLLYASGSGVYGDLKDFEAHEDFGPLVPVSTYGASKLAGEALIASYCAMFDLRACAFRFGNVVGARQTHGVGFDFIRRLRVQPDRLRILGDGRQSKSYIHVDDVVEAVLLAHRDRTEKFRSLQRRHRRLHHGHRNRQAGHRSGGALRRSSSPGIHRRGSRLERRRAHRSLEYRSHSQPGLDLQTQHRQALCVALNSMLADSRLGRL